MDVLQWGSNAWTFLHAITFNFPVNPTNEEKNNHRIFFHSLKYVLPCEACRRHYTKGIETSMPIEPHLESRDKLTRWLVDFHNNVNERLGKPKQTYDSVREKYESMRGRCQISIISDATCPSVAPPTCDNTLNKKTTKKTQILLFIVILILLILLIMGTYGYQCITSNIRK